MDRNLGRRKLWLFGRRLKSGSPRAVVIFISLIIIIFEFFFLTWEHGFNRDQSSSAKLHRLQEMRHEICSHRQLNEKRVEFRCKYEMCFAIVLTVNLGFYEFFLNWYKHYEKSVLRSSDHQIQVAGDNASDPIGSRAGAEDIPFLLVIAEDDEVLKRLSSLDYLQNEKVDIIRSASASHRNADNKAVDYNSVQYRSLVSSRATHLLNLMCSIPDEEQSKNGSMNSFKRWILLYSDVDTVWLKNPIPIIQKKLFQGISKNVATREPDYDIIAQMDYPKNYSSRNKLNSNTYYCTGFLIFVPTDVSYIFLSHWENALISHPQLNQPIFNNILVDKLLSDEDIHMRHGELSVHEFPSGMVYFDIFGYDKNKTELQARAVVVHNNFIVGYDKKKKRFEDNMLWLV